jgi:hypothetical protein
MGGSSSSYDVNKLRPRDYKKRTLADFEKLKPEIPNAESLSFGKYFVISFAYLS